MSDTSFPVYMHYGTAAQRAAFTPSPPATGQPIYIWYETDTGDTYIYDTSWHLLTSGGGGGTVLVNTVNGRLTTESGVPISNADRTAQGTIYFTPFRGNQIALYDGAAWQLVSFAELSLALTVTSGNNYDVFVDYNGGTPQLALSAAWTNDTTRADALALQDGVYVKSGATDHRLVGTIRASGANVTADSEANRYVWNAYNRVPRSMRAALETTNSWTYTTATFRQANANTANQLNYVVGLAEDAVEVDVYAIHANSVTLIAATAGIGINSTSVNSAHLFGIQHVNTTNYGITAKYRGTPATVGYNFIAWLERSVATGVSTWFGDNGDATAMQSGISGTVWN